MSDDFMRSFRNNIFMQMKCQNITLQGLADQADIPVSTLKSLLYGYAGDCHISTAIRISKVLNISVDELIGASTIAEPTCESLEILRSLPESFTHFVRWIIRFHRDMTYAHPEIKKAVEVMHLKCTDAGNLMVTSNLEFSDISHFAPDLRAKVFMGIIMPAVFYEPFYFQGDTIYIANDRAPREGEHVVVSIAGNIWILQAKRNHATTDYYSLRDARLFATADQVQSVIGYVTHTKRGV